MAIYPREDLHFRKKKLNVKCTFGFACTELYFNSKCIFVTYYNGEPMNSIVDAVVQTKNSCFFPLNLDISETLGNY